MKFPILNLILLTTLISNPIFADSMGYGLHDSNPSGWVGTISAGPTWAYQGREETFFLTPDIIKTYLPDKSIPGIFYGEFFIGRQKSWTQTIESHLGLALAASNDAQLNGFIIDTSGLQPPELDYNYDIQHTHLALKAKVLTDWGWFLPWLSASVGVGFNNAHGFVTQGADFIPEPVFNFKSHQETSLTYTLGLGIQKTMNPHWQIGMGYEFADWGRSGLDRAEGQILNTGLSLNHFYTNGLVFNLTYLT